MTERLDIVIRNGTVFDGSGGPPFHGDVAIDEGRIVGIGHVTSQGREEFDARGKLITPGFVDIHTHYDGQAIWSERLKPSSLHGVTTAVMGNCGVGFAPCPPDEHHRRSLIHLLEGVEDIPEIVMTEGLTWDWESFPEFLDALESRPHDMDLAAYVPHSALRIAVMGERGARREPATAEDLEQMSAQVYEAVKAGAIGFSTSRLIFHRTSDGDLAPSFDAAETELTALAGALRRAGHGVFQLVSDFGRDGPNHVETEFGLLRRLAAHSGGRVTYSLAEKHDAPDELAQIVALTRQANLDGLQISGQYLPRPMGIIVGHTVSLNPFSLCPAYQAIADRPLDARLRALHSPDVRKDILDQFSASSPTRIAALARDFERTFPLAATPDYEPSFAMSMAGQAKTRGLRAEEFAYDALLEDDGCVLWFVAFGNYAHGSLDSTLTLLHDPHCVLGIGDGGAHYGMICDASYPTTVLTHWTRDRVRGERISLQHAVRELTALPSAAVGLLDRGMLRPGYKADLNVIDHDRLSMGAPYVTTDLPGNGKRLNQRPDGYDLTVLNGRITYRNGEATGLLPGRLIRS